MSTPGPSVPPAGGPGRPRLARSGVGLLAVAVAGLALVLALVATVLSVRAVGRANEALDKLSAAGPSRGAAAEPTRPATSGQPVAEQTTDAPAPDQSETEPELNKQTRYEFKYTDQTLRVPATSRCGDTVYIDLDEPRVQSESDVAELEFHGPCGSGAPYFDLNDGVKASEVTSDKMTPYECADQIRTAPIVGEKQPLRRGQVYCLRTSWDAAHASANTWKIVVFSVTAMPQDGSVTLTATAWNIPG